MRRAFFTSALLAMVLLQLQGCSPSSIDMPDEQSKPLKIGYTHEPPYSEISEQGVPSGIFPDLAKQIAGKAGKQEIEWVLLSFDMLVPALLEKRIDVLAAGISITQARQKMMCFSKPIFSSHTAALILEESSQKEGEKASESLRRFAVINGSVEAKLVKSQLPNRYVLEVEDPHLGILSLKQEKADALLLTEPSLRYLLKQYGRDFHIERLEQFSPTKQFSAFAFHPSAKNLQLKWNQAQQALINSPWFEQFKLRNNIAEYHLELINEHEQREAGNLACESA